MAGVLSWKWGEPSGPSREIYYIKAAPNWTICRWSVCGEPLYWLYRGKERLGRFASNSEARSKADELEAS